MKRVVKKEGGCGFITSNGYGFHLWDNKYFHSFKDIEDAAGQYEFINV